ncbi:MAG TPA: hypothetical protein VMF50_17665 [Candidatus Binataceae bacterium]|nr:hypothetical protein [Candidatus Binataceae bacterium]
MLPEGDSSFRARHHSATRRCIVILALCAALAGCATTTDEDPYRQHPISIQTVEYYPYQVKGYQNTYPKRTMIVLRPVDARTFQGEAAAAADHNPYQGQPAIGVVLGRDGRLEQRLYGPALEPLTQESLVKSAREAGLNAIAADDPLGKTLKDHPGDYVLAATIIDTWVNKHRGPSNPEGSIWFTAADVTIDAAIYKAPFDVPFWQGESAAQFDDPPIATLGSLDPEDDTAIYGEPGQVLSVAFTRAVAGLFKRDDLRTLIGQDTNISRQ